jgi:hypothetical protein
MPLGASRLQMPLGASKLQMPLAGHCHVLSSLLSCNRLQRRPINHAGLDPDTEAAILGRNAARRFGLPQ